MKQRKLWFFVSILVLILCNVRSAETFEGTVVGPFRWYIDRLCLEEEIKPGRPFPIGCEIWDCCPSCPGPVWEISWDIILEADEIGFIQSVTLEFENMPHDAAKHIKFKGNAKWLKDNLLQISPGKAMVNGFTVDSKSQPLMVIPHLVVDRSMVKKYLGAMDKNPDLAGKDFRGMKFSVKQMLGSVRVSEYDWLVVIDRCKWNTGNIGCDVVELNNNTGNDSAVVYIDGRRNSGCVNDTLFRGADRIDVDNLLHLGSGSCSGDVAVFSDDNAMEFFTIFDTDNIWTDSCGDILKVNMKPLLQMPVTVWLAAPNRLTQAQNDIANANLWYNNNHVGVAFNAIYNNVSGNSSAVTAIENALACVNLTPLQNSQWYTPNRLNVYYVGRQLNNTATGWNCIADRNIIYISTMPRPASLAHEIGHSFSLNHTNGVTGFGVNNIMWAGGTDRTHFSEGQAFRMNVNCNSTLNTDGVRTGICLNCPDTTTSAQCPDLALDAVPN